MRLMIKTLSYGTIHVGVAATVAFVLTGNWAIALGIGLLEPVVQTLVFPLHEWLWERRGRVQADAQEEDNVRSTRLNSGDGRATIAGLG